MRTAGIAVVACLAALSWTRAAEQAVVIVPVADLWSAPLPSTITVSDELRQTQLLFGEEVTVQAASGSWRQVAVPDQPAYRPHGRWEGYPGWVAEGALALFHSPRGSRGAVLDIARGLIGAPYVWGGLTTQGADCSGLTYLAFRLNGVKVPRDSFEQWMKAQPLRRSQLLPADLIFSAKSSDPKTISHVALYAGDGMIVEAPQKGVPVREISFRDKYGKELSAVESGDTVGEHVVFFGRYLKR